jgi:hypothetical protein
MGQNITRPVAAAVLELKEIARTLIIGNIHSNANADKNIALHTRKTFLLTFA